MRDSLELCDKAIENFAESKNLQNNLVYLVENLYKDLENERNANTGLQKQIFTLSNQDLFGLPSKFTTLKADYMVLKEKLVALKNENEDLNIQLIAKSQENNQTLAEKTEQLKCYYQSQLKQKDTEISEKQQQIELFKENFKQKEYDLYNEVHTAEMSTMLQIDKLEEDFKKQINESNKKLKESMDTCNNLRMELISVKEQFIEHKRTSSEKISELQRKLREFQNSDTLQLEQSPVDMTEQFSEQSTKYQPLDINFRRQSNDKPINLKKVPVYRSFARLRNDAMSLPPLINLKTTTDKENVPKRRKLYNPEDLSYLSEQFDEDVL